MASRSGADSINNMATSTTARATNSPAKGNVKSRKKAGSSKLGRIVKTVLIVLLIIAASVGATLYYSGMRGDLSLFGFGTAEAEEVNDTTEVEKPVSRPSAPPAKPIFAPLETFTVTLTDGHRTRILHVAITLRLDDDASRQLLTEFMPVVRDRVLKTLSAQNPFHVQTPAGREELVLALGNVLRAPYDPDPTQPRISNVLFTAFVVQ